MVLNKKNYEITTYRKEQSIKGDLSVRDFTINAIAYHPKRDLLTLFPGIEDIKNSTIRSVGKAKNVF